MELEILIPTLVVGIVFGVGVLLHSLQKVAGKPFRFGKAIEPSEEDGSGVGLWRLESEIPTASLDASTPGELPICWWYQRQVCEFHHPVQRLTNEGIAMSTHQ